MTKLRMRHIAAGVSALGMALLAAVPVSAQPRELGAGQLPIELEPSAPIDLSGVGELVIEGVHSGDGEAYLVLRIDDEDAPTYNERYNGEHAVQPGPFRIVTPASDLRTTDGRPLRLDEIRRIILFSDDDDFEITRFEALAAGDAAAAPVEAPQAGSGALEARDLGAGRLPIELEPSAPIDLSGVAELVIEGVHSGDGEAYLVLRIDDEDAPTYNERYNGEHAVRPGRFRIVTPASDLKATDGRPLRLNDIRRIILFSDDDVFEITRFEALSTDDARAPAQIERAAIEPRDFGSGRAPLTHDFSRPIDLSPYDEILIEGVATTETPIWVLLRIDDGQSSDYASRYNLEVELPSGPFRLRASLGGLRSPSGRVLDPSDVRLVDFWFDDDDATIEVTRFEARSAPRLPNGAIGYSFGHPDASVPPGFERIGPQDPRIFGEISAVARPTPDPLVANGLRGVRAIRLDDVPPGDYRVTVWSEDPGEWEYLPHPLRRVIRANDVEIRRDETNPRDWIAERYLRGLAREHTPDDDAYTAYGAFRGEPRSAQVPVGSEGLRIELGGDTNAATYISAILIEPAVGGGAAERAVEEARSEWYREFWRLDPSWRESAGADAPMAATLTIAPSGAFEITGPDGAPTGRVRAAVAPGTGVRVTIEAVSEAQTDASARIVAPSFGAVELEGMLWTGHWRLERRLPGDTILSLADNTLLPTGAAPIHVDRPRRYEMWFEAPADAPPGLYTGALEITTPLGVFSAPIDIEVLDVALPPTADPAGFYLVEAPHLEWFAGEPLDRQRQAACDVRFMIRFDLRGSAPAVTTPRLGNTLATTLDLRLANDLGLAPPWLVYGPMQGLQFEFAPGDGAALLATVETELRTAGSAAPAWSVADELSNPGNPATEQFWPWVEAIRAASPGVILAGHINSPSDRAYLDAFDVVLTNGGFGLDAATIADLADRGLKVWFYNTFQPRVTAGYWLWATEGDRYVQWHARMPTADPFDPIDGREGDVQALLPSVEICPPLPGVHRDFLRLAEGVVDQRWLLWLDAQTSPEADALRRRLRARADDGWAETARAGDSEMARIRAEIMALVE